MNITRAILELRIKYAAEDKQSPSDINSGWCSEFADDIAEQGFGIAVWGGDLLWESWSEIMQSLHHADFQYIVDCHCFIYYEHKYYDSECPQGCDYPDQLPCYQRNTEPLLYEDAI